MRERGEGGEGGGVILCCAVVYVQCIIIHIIDDVLFCIICYMYTMYICSSYIVC